MNQLLSPSEFFQAVALAVSQNGHARFRARGNSMRPLIADSAEVILERADTLHIGDIVLALTSEQMVVLHRIVKISGDNLTLSGDGNFGGTESAYKSGVAGRVSIVVSPSGKSVSVDSLTFRLKSLIWRILKPIRPLLLRK